MNGVRKITSQMTPGHLLATVVSAVGGGVIGAEAVMNPHAGLLTKTIGPWLIRHGFLSAPVFDAYDTIIRTNIDRLLPGLGTYVLFSLYWAFAARSRGDDAKVDSAPYSLHRLLVGLSLVLVCLPLPGLTFRLIPASPPLLALGLSVEAGGTMLAIAARRALGRNWSREVRIAVGHELVQSGPYARIRHPIYTGAIAISLGLAIQSGLLSGLVGLAVLILAYIRKIGLEERMLRSAFGPSFDQYRARSWSVIPFVI